MRSAAPAAGSAPTGISPTSSAPATSIPRAPPSTIRATISCKPAVSSSRSCSPGRAPAEGRNRARGRREAAVRSRTIARGRPCDPTSSVRRFTRTTSCRRAPTGRRPRRVQPQRPGSRGGSAGVDPGLARGQPRRKNAGRDRDRRRMPQPRCRHVATSRAAARARSMSSGLIGTSGGTSAAPMGCAPCAGSGRFARGHARHPPQPPTSPFRTDSVNTERVGVVRVGVHAEQAAPALAVP